MTPQEVEVEEKTRRFYRIHLFDDLRYKSHSTEQHRSSISCQADVTISLVNSAGTSGTPLAKKNDGSSLTGDLGNVSGLSGLMEQLRLAGNNSETTDYMVTFVKEPTPETIIIDIKEAAPVDDTPGAVVTKAKAMQVNPVEETSAFDIKEAETIDVASDAANYEKAVKIED